MVLAFSAGTIIDHPAGYLNNEKSFPTFLKTCSPSADALSGNASRLHKRLEE